MSKPDGSPIQHQVSYERRVLEEAPVDGWRERVPAPDARASCTCGQLDTGLVDPDEAWRAAQEHVKRELPGVDWGPDVRPDDDPPVQCWHYEPGSPCDWDVCRQPDRLAAGDRGTDPARASGTAKVQPCSDGMGRIYPFPYWHPHNGAGQCVRCGQAVDPNEQPVAHGYSTPPAPERLAPMSPDQTAVDAICNEIRRIDELHHASQDQEGDAAFWARLQWDGEIIGLRKALCALFGWSMEEAAKEGKADEYVAGWMAERPGEEPTT